MTTPDTPDSPNAAPDRLPFGLPSTFKDPKRWGLIAVAALPFLAATIYMTVKPAPVHLQRTHGGSANAPLSAGQRAGGFVGINPTEKQSDPVEEPEDPVEEPEDPVEEPEDPVEEPEDPVGKQEKPVEKQSDPAEGQEKPAEGQEAKPPSGTGDP